MSSTVVKKLEDFVGKFIEHLVDPSPYLMPIVIPQLPLDINYLAELEYDDHEELSVTRNFENYSSQKKYAQIFAIASLVFELVSSKCLIQPNLFPSSIMIEYIHFILQLIGLCHYVTFITLLSISF